MGDGVFWFFFFAVQGVFADMFIILTVLGGMLFLLYKWINFKIDERKERKEYAEQQKLREAIVTQTNQLLRDIEGL